MRRVWRGWNATCYFCESSRDSSWATNIIYPDSDDVDGPYLSVSGIAWASGVATATTTTAHGYSAGDWVRIVGANEAGFNGWFQIATVPSTTTFTYAIASGVPEAATGTITVKRLGTDQVRMTYDRLGRTLTSRDQRGVVHSYSFDSAGRLSADAVTTLPAGVDGAVRRIGYAYDTLGRLELLSTYDAASGGSVVNQIQYEYDAWGNVSREWQEHDEEVDAQTLSVQYIYEDGDEVEDPNEETSNEVRYVRLDRVIYPDGDAVYYNYPSSGVGGVLSRLDNIAADANGNTQYERYTYLGVGTIVKIERPAVSGGLSLSYGTSANHYAALDRFGRVKDQVWTGSGGDVSSHSYTYDGSSNITADANNLASEFSEQYTFDDLDRLVDANRNSGNFQDWTLDDQGNWAGFTDEGTSQTRQHSEANEITGITVDPAWPSPRPSPGVPGGGREGGDRRIETEHVHPLRGLSCPSCLSV